MVNTRWEWMVIRFFVRRKSSVEPFRIGEICWIISNENVSSTCNISVVVFVRLRLINRIPVCDIPNICTSPEWYFGILMKDNKEKMKTPIDEINIQKQEKIDKNMLAIDVLVQ